MSIGSLNESGPVFGLVSFGETMLISRSDHNSAGDFFLGNESRQLRVRIAGHFHHICPQNGFVFLAKSVISEAQKDVVQPVILILLLSPPKLNATGDLYEFFDLGDTR